jgi:hypothetical protein
MHAHDHRQGRIDLGEDLRHAAVTRLGQSLTAVLRIDVQATQARLAQRPDDVVADPPLLLRLARVDQLGGDLAEARDQRADPVLLFTVGLRIGKDELLVDLAEEQRLREATDRGGGFHQAGVAARFPSTSSGLRGGAPT